MRKLLLIACSFIGMVYLTGQEYLPENIPNGQIKSMISSFKSNSKGPYVSINWYCKDGKVQGAHEPCGDVGGVQRATYSNQVKSLGENSHIFLGQILAATDQKAFLDEENYFSRMKQYQIEKYLRAIDDGWILRKAQYYRGAFQDEDEQNWGHDFFVEYLGDDNLLTQHFFLLREAAKDIPHSGDSNEAQEMRSISKKLAEEESSFTNLRIKIHGQPEISDIQSVKEYKASHQGSLTEAQNKELDDLVAVMTDYFKPMDASVFTGLVDHIADEKIKSTLTDYFQSFTDSSPNGQMSIAADAMWYVRNTILDEDSSEGRLSMFDLSLKLEQFLKTSVSGSDNSSVDDLLEQLCILSRASAACGYTEFWEWDALYSDLAYGGEKKMTLGRMNNFLVAARKQLEWGTTKTGALFENEITIFNGFEPKVHSFIDDRIRGSISLELGNAIGKLGKFIADESSLNNQVMGIPNQSHVHGLNPGYAQGKLVVVEGEDRGVETNPSDIYVFAKAPSDLKPVSGIMTVSEGNLVSHVQLLARNLGIPNAAISADNFSDLKAYDGKEVFYAVTSKGTVLMKEASKMTTEEKNLFTEKEQNTEMITIDTEPIRLDVNQVLNLRDVDATYSGIYCGPKAANMGELKMLFPDHVVEGMVIPFGIFLDHMKMTIPGQNVNYWDFLNETFETGRQMASDGKSAKEVETYELGRLAKLREYIMAMDLKDSFIEDLNSQFVSLLGKPLGEVGVFLRSDTNMEDLDNFTGAGLNLTKFNVRDKEKIITGIKEVWASPYSERSFRWRQKYLTNPEAVFPSILVIPGVNNDCSGVMITKGVESGEDDERTVAFSRGVGGAVDGQIAETWVLKHKVGSSLVSPSRQPINKFLADEGLKYEESSFEKPILTYQNRVDLMKFSNELIKKMTEQNIEGPYDTELGFKDDKIWLFQIRPFVENKNAKSSSYLESITPKVDYNKNISLQTKL